MSSGGIPVTQCVHIFEGELQQLRSRLNDDPVGNGGLRCYLYGLWTHSSNVVVYLIVTHREELFWAEKHQLDCVGYVAEEYTEYLYEVAKEPTQSMSSRRQHVIVDVSDTKVSGKLHAYGSHREVLRRRENVYNPQRRLQVNILKNESPFRKDVPVKVETNGHQIESESRWNSGDKGGRTVKEIDNAHVGKELSIMNSAAEREHRNGSNIETGSGGNQMNGYQEAKITQSLSIVRSITHKVKDQFGVRDEHITIEEFPDKLMLRFGHNHKRWSVELKWGESGQYFVEISSSSSQNAYSGEFYQSDVVVNKIKELCGCENCSKQLKT